MSQENVETFQRTAEAYNEGDFDAVLEGFDPEVEWHAVFQVMFGGPATVCRGREEVRDYMRELAQDFAAIDVKLEEFRDLGERLVVIGRVEASGRASGARIDAPIVFVADFKAGRIFRMTDYLDPDKGLEAAGLSE
jgi:ketosteroid isomerase-like protein